MTPPTTDVEDGAEHVVICWECGFSAVEWDEKSAARKSVEHYHPDAKIDTFSREDVEYVRSFDTEADR